MIFTGRIHMMFAVNRKHLYNYHIVPSDFSYLYFGIFGRTLYLDS